MFRHTTKDKSNPKEKRHIIDCLQGLVSPIYAVMMFGIILICIIFWNINYAFKYISLNYLPTVILLFFGIAIVFGIYTICNHLRVAKQMMILFPIVAVGLLILQIYAVMNYYFYTDWDVPYLVDLSDALAHGGDPSSYVYYFSKYPNNLFLLYIYTKIRRVADIFGHRELEYQLILATQCFLSSATGVFLVGILNDIFHNYRLSIIGYVLYIFLVGMSPWVSIPYSDSMGLLFPTLILFLYIKSKKVKIPEIFWGLIGLFTVIGFRIKPQIAIITIAILIAELFRIFKKGISKRWITGASSLAVGLLVAAIISGAAISTIPLKINKEGKFGIQHFYMMGMNPHDMGVWSSEDYGFTNSFDTLKERNDADLAKANERVHNMGVVGLSKQFARKTLTNYNDGTFFWGGEGKFFVDMVTDPKTRISGPIRSLYYTRSQAETGKNYLVWANFEQMIWQTILLLSAFMFLAKKDSKKDIIALTIMGLTLFELIFEARSRYLYIYAPFYIILAVYGLDGLSLKFQRKAAAVKSIDKTPKLETEENEPEHSKEPALV